MRSESDPTRDEAPAQIGNDLTPNRPHVDPKSTRSVRCKRPLWPSTRAQEATQAPPCSGARGIRNFRCAFPEPCGPFAGPRKGSANFRAASRSLAGGWRLARGAFARPRKGSWGLREALRALRGASQKLREPSRGLEEPRKRLAGALGLRALVAGAPRHRRSATKRCWQRLAGPARVRVTWRANVSALWRAAGALCLRRGLRRTMRALLSARCKERRKKVLSSISCELVGSPTTRDWAKI